MSGGSLKDLVKTLNGALATSHPLYPLPDDVLQVIHAYVTKHSEVDDHESQRLHEELLSLHAAKVQNHPDKHAFFLACFRNLRPALIGVDRLLKWWELLVKPTLDSMGTAKAVVADARQIVLSVLAYEDDDDPTGQKAAASSVFTDKLFEAFLEKTKLLSSDRSAGFKEEQRQRFVCANVEAVLLAFGKRRPKVFLEKIDAFVVQKEYRLQILGLLCSFVRLQGPHLYQILQTPLFGHLVQCLEQDTSTTVISSALTSLIMFLPHVCNQLAVFIPRLFVIYARVLCWDKYGVVRAEEQRESPEDMVRSGTPQSSESEGSKKSEQWQKVDSSFETAQSTMPDVSDYFTFLYGLYPINFLNFVREPYKFLDRARFKDIDSLEIEEDVIRQRSDIYRQRHLLHSNFLKHNAESELKDHNRWKLEPADITAQCIGFVNNSAPRSRSRSMKVNGDRPLPEALVPTEDIPSESLLGSLPEIPPLNVEVNGSGSLLTPQSEDGEHNALRSRTVSPLRGQRSPPRDAKAPDSPTIPTSDHTEEQQLQDMLDLQEQLRNQLEDEQNFPPPPGPPPIGPPPDNPVGQSPGLGAYVQSLSKSNIPRSPALRPATSDTQGTIAYLQREVMLLKNDLNFERYLKQQHLSHIGHLQRKHINESTAEAETQNLINTNKSLRAKLEEAKKAYAASRQEAMRSKNQAKKWEAELSAKIRTLREEQKAWRADEETTKTALQQAREETDHLRKLLTESEASGLRARQKLQSLDSEMDEVNKLRKFVDHLSSKLDVYESRNEEFEVQRHSEEAAIAQADRMKLRIQSREQEMQKVKRNYEMRIAELETRLSSINPSSPASPNSNFQGMLDNALNNANQKLAALKKAHQSLLTKYTELEIKYIELQASSEMNEAPILQQRAHHKFSTISESFSDSESEQSTARPFKRSPPHYQLSEGSGSPHSSYTDFSGSGHGHSNTSTRHTSSATGPLSPTFSSTSNLSPEVNSERFHPLKRRDSIPESMATGGSGSGGVMLADDQQSLKTVTSTTSSEKRRLQQEKIKPKSEIRVRGRGGVQNIGKDKKEKKEKKSKFGTGSGLAGIRGIVG